MNLVIMRTFIFIIGFLALSILITGCGSACKDLANKVCDCQPTRSKKERCEIAINAAARNMDLSDEEEDRCQAILDSDRCTCQALETGDFSACGLSVDPMITY